MKRIVFIIIIAIIGALNGFAQSQVNVIHRMDRQGLRWTEDRRDIWGGTNNCPDWTDWVYEYYTTGDTIINAMRYAKVFSKDLYVNEVISHQIYNSPCNFTYSSSYSAPDSFLVCGLREDSTGKVYIHIFDTLGRLRNLGNSLIGNIALKYESLLYDFRAKAGDTLPIIAYGYSKVVSSVDSVMLPDTTYRKRFKLSDHDYLTEGIGTRMSLFGALMFAHMDGDNFLICFRDSGKNGARTCDSSEYFGSGTKDIAGHNVAPFRIFPNPARYKTYLRLLTPLSYNTIQVYDITSALLQTIPITKPITHIDVSNYPNGVYVFKLTDKNGATYIQKMVVSH